MAADDTICAIATAVGVGAVGMVRLSGPRAEELLRQACPALGQIVPRRMHAARLMDHGGLIIDRVLVCLMPGPRSYTGEDVVEVHGHGGARNLERILSLFVGLGARVAEPGEFSRRAFLNGRVDLAQAEAVARIVAARSDRALQNAQAILDGALGRRLGQLRRQLVELCALLEAAIDFAEDTEDQSGELSSAALAHRHEMVSSSIAGLAETYRTGRRLDGVTVALVGPVNAGKSSLFNRLLGSERALVSDEPGTTRDYLEAETQWDGLRIVLVDTGGERPATQQTALECRGQALTAPVLERCDLVVHVVDRSLPTKDQVWPELNDTGPVLVVANKVDLCAGQPLPPSNEGTLVVSTSAVTGQGLEQLKRAVLGLLVAPETGPEARPEPETVQVVHERHHHALMRAHEAVESGRQALDRGVPPEVVVEHSREALGALREITGERFTEDVLDVVFSRFCVGK